jgi:hypothetical protein
MNLTLINPFYFIYLLKYRPKYMLHLTSFIFSTIVLHAHYSLEHDIHLLFLLVTIFSISFHTISFFETLTCSNPAPLTKHIIFHCDRFLAHCAVVYVTFKAHSSWGNYIFIFTAIISWIWYKRVHEKSHSRGVLWHVFLHFFSTFTVHLYLARNSIHLF